MKALVTLATVRFQKHFTIFLAAAFEIYHGKDGRPKTDDGRSRISRLLFAGRRSSVLGLQRGQSAVLGLLF